MNPAAPSASFAVPTPPGGFREIPFNYTSADDRQALSLLLGPDIVQTLEKLRAKRVTGRSARLLMRFFGELLIHRRNPYLFQELVDSSSRRNRLFEKADKDLAIIERNVGLESQVKEVLTASRQLLAAFRQEVERVPEERKRIHRELDKIVGGQNVLFDPFSLVAHATDATDWRLHLPLAVVMPDKEEQVAPLLAAVGRLGLKAIPRGGGTGLTGGAIPLRLNCVVINTEKLDRIKGTQTREFRLMDGSTAVAQVLTAEAGVVTEKAMEYAGHRGWVFATDPTSAWASTLGGNIAENAGGKLAVRWGTCIDNLLGWNMAMPGGRRWSIRRTDHQLRKILPDDVVCFEVQDEQGRLIKRIELKGSEIRKKGLWKDITNKALKGVPGLQKEGTDGLITSAEFILYPPYEASRTLCLEFFGQDMDEASKVILDLSHAFPFPDQGGETLLALEHFDEEYVMAIHYQVKSTRAETPKAVLIIDVAGHTDEQARRGVEKIRAVLERYPNSQFFEARDKAEAARFWADRKKFGAIARRTNAFKINEDIVIPLEALAEFARFIDGVNVDEERYAQKQFLDRAAKLLSEPEAEEDDESFAAKAPLALGLLEQARQELAQADKKSLRNLGVITRFRQGLAELLRGFERFNAKLEKTHQEVRDRRIVLATHMHAGDGNVHVNLPVLSNDRPMLDRASAVVDIVMEKVVKLGGVVSGEHGIGVTKLKYLDQDILDQLAAHRRDVDPQGIMNPGKLEDLTVLDHLFTPSFNLLELEARILRHGQLEELAKKIAHCVRCGKCKPDCCMFHPSGSLFYHPRNKNLAIGSIIEALLYDAQREHSTQFELLRWLEAVSDHCTTCHKCLKPCPVDIDTGEVSVLERKILADWGYKHTPLATRMTLQYLDSRSPLFNQIFRASVLRAGIKGQQIASLLAKPLQPRQGPSPFYPLRLLKSSLPTVPAKTLRDVVPKCEADQVLVFEPAGESATTVLYFPGCGSERMVSTISMAVIHVLLAAKTRVILPPPFLCCGFPLKVNAKTGMHQHNELRVTILFNQIRDMFSHLDFDACVVSCGTCREGLVELEAAKLFGGRQVDIASYAMERGLKFEGEGGYLYHAPCHDSLVGKAREVLGKIGGFGDITSVPHCCSEAGTLSLSRPDITGEILERKKESLRTTVGEKGQSTILTNCPSCVQGLGRNRGIGVTSEHIAVALAEKLSGKDWQVRFRAQAVRATAFNF